MSGLTRLEEITRRSYDREADAWMDGHWTPKFWGENFDAFYELLPEGRVLEVGCGAGRDAQELIKHGYEYVGTDIAPNLLALARKNNTGAEFHEASLYSLDFKEPFDGFWCAAVLIHIPKSRIDEALSAIRQNLKSRAIGFIAVKEGEGERLESKPDLNNASFLFSYWGREEFRDVLARNGFETLHEDYNPMSERTKWLTYIVRAEKVLL